MDVAGGGAAFGRLRRFLGGAGRKQRQFQPYQQRQHHRGPRSDRHLDHYRDASEYVYRDGFVELLGDRAYGRFQRRHVQPFVDLANLQHHDGANLNADRDYFGDDDHGSISVFGNRHFFGQYRRDHYGLR